MKSVINTPHPIEKIIIRPLRDAFLFIIRNDVLKLWFLGVWMVEEGVGGFSRIKKAGIRARMELTRA